MGRGDRPKAVRFDAYRRRNGLRRHDAALASVGTALESAHEDRVRRCRAGCVWQGTSELKVRWHEILELTGTMQELAELTSTQAKAVTALSEDVFGNMHTVAAATDPLAATVREIAGHADDASQGALVGSKQAETTATTVRELGLASPQVGNVAALIGTIASQTKLLALNARIEAANAGGDAGSAFAVVAREVKGLAEQTASATQSVGATATEISDGCNRATAAIEAITSTMRRVSENQSSIASAVEQQSGATQEIGRLSAETANGSSEISCNIMELSDLTRRLAFSGSLGRSLEGGLAEIEGTLSQPGSTFVIGDVAEASSQLRQNAEKPVARVGSTASRTRATAWSRSVWTTATRCSSTSTARPDSKVSCSGRARGCPPASTRSGSARRRTRTPWLPTTGPPSSVSRSSSGWLCDLRSSPSNRAATRSGARVLDA